MAIEYELHHRIIDQDSRRILFAYQEALLGMLNPAWQVKKKEEHQLILESNPFDDLSKLRANYYSELYKQGYSEKEILQLAYQKYPLSN